MASSFFGRHIPHPRIALTPQRITRLTGRRAMAFTRTPGSPVASRTNESAGSVRNNCTHTHNRTRTHSRTWRSGHDTTIGHGELERVAVRELSSRKSFTEHCKQRKRPSELKRPEEEQSNQNRWCRRRPKKGQGQDANLCSGAVAEFLRGGQGPV